MGLFLSNQTIKGLIIRYLLRLTISIQYKFASYFLKEYFCKKYYMKKIYTLFVLILSALKVLAQVNTNPESGPGACNGSASIGQQYFSGTWYNVNDSLNSIASGVINISNLCAGSYFVDALDSLGSTRFFFTITTNNPCPNPPNVSINGADQIYNGGSAFLSANGAAFYEWNTGATTQAITVSPNTTTTYIVIGTDSLGCRDTAFWLLTVLACTNPPVVSITGTTQIIWGQTGTLTASGAVQYSWSTNQNTPSISVSPTITTNFFVVGSDSLGCKDTAFWTVTVIPDTSNPCANFAALAQATNTSVFSCNGTITVTANSENPLEFNWADSLLSGSNIIGLCAGTYSVTVTDLINNCSDQVSATVVPDSSFNPCLGFQVIIDSTANESFPNAGDGQVFASIYGGSAPFKYNWGDGLASDTAFFSGLYGGTFNLTVSDANGCSAFANGYINTSAPTSGPCVGVSINVSLAASIQSTNLCNAAITSNVSGGTTPYDYQWNNGFKTPDYTNACAGNYSLVVKDANGCLGSGFILINADTAANTAPLTVNIATLNTTDTVNCNGKVRINVSGGIAPYIIKYSNGAAGSQLSGLCADIYSVVVADANLDSAFFTFVIADSSNIFEIPANDPLNDSVLVASVSADALENCLVDLETIDSVRATNFWVNPSTDSLDVRWIVYSSQSGNDTLYQSYGVGPSGIYEIILSLYCSGRATKGFVKAYDKVQVNTRLSSIPVNAKFIKTEIYPNPFNTKLNIKLSNSSDILISDITGKVVAQYPNLFGFNSLVMQDLSKGLYFITIQNKYYKEVFKVVKE